MTRISDMTALSLTSPTGVFAPVEKTGSTTNYRVDLAAMSSVTPQLFGAVADGVTDDSAAFVAAIAYLKAFALNATGAGFYKGSPQLFIPAGDYYLGTTTLEVNHTLIIEGEGSGQFGPGAGGCSHLRWAAGANGIRAQGPNTSGNTTTTADHDGAGGVVLRDLCLEGGFAGTEGDFHGLVIRNAVKAENLYIKGWQGEGVKAWAGDVTGNGNVGGNVSTTLLIAVKTEGCRGGFDIRGSDANVVTTINCEGYQNRWFGLLDDNGAGSNTHIGFHAASNGVVTGTTWPQTQCSYSGNRYAAKWGADPTIAPSGTTADTANWLYIEAGGVLANTIPAWVNTANTFRAGGDGLTINSANVKLIGCYSETGGFSQFNVSTEISAGSLTSQYYRGGHRLIAANGGFRYVDNSGGATVYNLMTAGTETSLYGMDLSATVHGYVSMVKGAGNYYLAPLTTGHNFRVGTFGSNVTPVQITTDGILIASTYAIYNNGLKVVGARGSAVARLTRTATSGSLPVADGSITIANAATPTVVELLEYCTEIEAKLEAVTAAMRAATGHGLIA